jgi:hypothetical protein
MQFREKKSHNIVLVPKALVDDKTRSRVIRLTHSKTRKYHFKITSKTQIKKPSPVYTGEGQHPKKTVTDFTESAS